jgi:hypothetical protein
METVLYFVIATLLGMNIFVFRKNLKDKQQYNQDRESFLLERASVEKEHADNINQYWKGPQMILPISNKKPSML